MAVSGHGITFLFFNMNDAKQAHMPKPSNSSFNLNDTADCPRKSNHTNQNGVTSGASNIPRRIVENHTETIVPAAHGEVDIERWLLYIADKTQQNYDTHV